MSYFEIFIYCLSFALACGFIVHAAATLIISNLEDETDDLFPENLVTRSALKPERLLLTPNRPRPVLTYQSTSAN